jgi:glycosyl transferase family 87
MPKTTNEAAAVPRPATESRGITGAGLAATLTRPPIVMIVWLGAIFQLFAWLHLLPARPNHFDFSIYYASGLVLREHLDPYTTDLDVVGKSLNLEIDPIHYATDPPTFLLCFEPLTLLPLTQAFWLWTALNFAALVAALILLLRGSGLGLWTCWSLATLSLLYPPVGDHFFYGQNKIFVLLMLVLMMRWMGEGRDAAAGLTLGIATLMRGFPLLLIGYLLLRRRWRAIAYTAVGITIGGVLTIALLGLSQTLSFSHGVRFVTMPRFLALPINLSLAGFVSRMYWYAVGAGPGLSNFIRRLLVVTTQLGVLALTVKATLKSRDTADLDWRAFSLWVVTAVLLAPTAWVHYLVLMLIPFIMMAIAANRGRASDRAIWMAVASFLLIAPSASVRIAFGPHPHGVLRSLAGEGSFVSLALMYVSAYWFAADETPIAKIGVPSAWSQSDA